MAINGCPLDVEVDILEVPTDGGWPLMATFHKVQINLFEVPTDGISL